MRDRIFIRTFIEILPIATENISALRRALSPKNRQSEPHTTEIDFRQRPCNHKILCGLYIALAGVLSTHFYNWSEINFRWGESKSRMTVSTGCASAAFPHANSTFRARWPLTIAVRSQRALGRSSQTQAPIRAMAFSC